MDSVNLFVLLLILGLVPVAYVPQFLLPFEGGKFFVFVLLSALLLITNGLRDFLGSKPQRVPKKSIAMALFLFAAMFFLSTVTSISPLTSLIGAYGSFTGGLLYFLLLVTVYVATLSFQKDAKIILKTIFLTGLVVSFWGLWQYLTQGLVHHDIFFRVTSLIGQPNRLSFYLLTIIPVGFFLYQEEKNIIHRRLYGMGFFAMLFTLLLTFSRTTYVSLVILIGLYVFFEKIQKRPKRGESASWRMSRDKGLARGMFLKNALPALLALLVLLIFGLHIFRTLPGAFKKSAQSSFYLRLGELESAVTDIQKRNVVRTLIGNGPDTTYLTFFRYRPLIFNQSQEEFGVGPTQYRNHYIQLLSTVGLLGLVAYLFLFYQFLTSAYNQKPRNVVAQISSYGLLGVAINSLFYFQPESVLILFWVFGGLATQQQKLAKKSNLPLFGFVITLVGIIFLYGAVRGTLAEWYAGNQTRENLSRAISLNPLYDIYPRHLSQIVLSGALSKKETDKETAKNDLRKAIAWAHKAYAISPLDVRNLRQLVVSQYHMGVLFDKIYQQNNIKVAQTLVTLSPTDPRSWDYLGLVYLNLTNLPAAKENFEKERELISDSPTPYLHLGEVAKQQGNIKEAISLIQQAIKLSPGWNFAEEELNKITRMTHE